MDGRAKKLHRIVVLSALLFPTTLGFPSLSFGQEFDDDDFTTILPPEGFRGNQSPSATSPIGGGSPEANQGPSSTTENPLSKEKREKMARAGIEDISGSNFAEVIESFDFPNADITDVIKAISELTGKNFIIDPGISGKITIIAPTKITVAEAYKAFLSALAIRGLAVVPGDGFYKIRQATAAKKDGIDTYSGSYYPRADQFISRIIHLKHISAEKVNTALKNLVSSPAGEIIPYTDTNSVIITDYGSNIDRIQRVLSSLDVPGFEEQLEVMAVKFAKAKDIAELVSKIVNKGENRNQNPGGFVSGIPRTRGAQGSQGGAYFLVIPDDRTNSLIVSGNKAGIERIRKLLKQLDFRLNPEDQGGFYVYNVRFGDAEKISATLQSVIKDTTPKPNNPNPNPMISPISGVQMPTAEVFGGDVKITADKATNSLVVVSSKQDYETIKNLLAQIDSPRDQVFVEAIIMEMKASDAFSWKVGAFQFDKSGSGAKGGFNTFDGTSLGDLLNPASGSGAILPLGGGSDKVTITQPNGTSVTVPSLLGFINFLKTNSNANVLSTPQILALDNQEATIEVGDKVITGTQVSATAVGSIETPIFDDATIKLKIKPFISPKSNTIRMEIDSQVKQISTANTPPGLVSKSQPLATRRVTTNIVIPNGNTAVLGGLMKDDEVEKISKVPLLGDIPLLGWLFKSRQSERVKTNMLIFLTPKIIRNISDQKELLSRKVDQRLKYIKKAGGVDPYGETMEEVEQNMRSAQAPHEVQETAKPMDPVKASE